ncbi:MAG: hypothetical protein II858_05895 [Bacteroidales bacterium]|nr:hypothetical protein [Bacteroidales bacterium]
MDWLSQTTKTNALDKLAHCGLYVAYPDQWYEDCVSSYANCETLVEAVHRNNRNIASVFMDSNGAVLSSDLTLCNAMYMPAFNCVVIYPALMMPPATPDEGMSEACFHAAFAMIGHELTHGFDSQGSKYDKYGHELDWWTVADRMAFEDRTQNLINCYSHLEMEPGVLGRSGIYGDGTRTLTENIADLGGFLTVLDAYQARLHEQGFSRARLRVNGVVMNTDPGTTSTTSTATTSSISLPKSARRSGSKTPPAMTLSISVSPRREGTIPERIGEKGTWVGLCRERWP